MKAAEQGHTEAEGFISVCYAGLGVAKDDADADIGFLGQQSTDIPFRNTSSVGRTKSAWVAQDYAEAYFWLDLAASEKVEDTKRKEVVKRRDEAASHLSPADQARVQERVRDWHEEHPAKLQ